MRKGHVMSRPAISLFVLCLLLCSASLTARDRDADLETVSPEKVGWSSPKLTEAARYAEQLGFSALMLVYDGKVFFSWGDVETNLPCHSIRKPFLSALYGIYVDNKTIDVDLTMEKLGIDDIAPKLTAPEKQATIRQLLQGRSGVYHEAAGEAESMKVERPERGAHKPGEFFYYNNWDFNALGTIFRQRTGKDIFREFQKGIADPIGMQDFDVSKCEYKYEKEKSEHPVYVFRMSARDMARFGVLYQKGGAWEGKQIIPERWVSESTATYSAQDSTLGAGFGYMWGTILEGSRMAQLLGGSGIFFSGIGVHSLVVIPELKLVLVLRMDTEGDWTPPPPGTAGKLYSMITGARMTK